MNKIISQIFMCLTFLVSTVQLSVSAEEGSDRGVFTNVCMMARAIFSSGGSDVDEMEERFDCVRHGGFFLELESGEWQSFSNLCEVVSNHYPAILQNWGCYSTNDVIRFSVLNAVAFSGEQVFTNFVDRFVSNFQPSSAGDWESLGYLVAPFGTPLEQYLAMRCEYPPISNLLSRVALVAEQGGKTNLFRSCSRRISGEVKIFLQENQ